MRRALAALNIGGAVALLRAMAGLSQLDLANLVTGWSQSTVSLIESGRRDTLYDIRVLLDFADAVAMPRQALLPLLLGDETAAEIDIERAVDMDRRSFTGMVAGLFIPGSGVPFAVPGQVTSAHVKYYFACAQKFYQRDQLTGGAPLLHQALLQLGRARQMLETSDYTDAIGRQLLSATGELAVCCGWLAYDTGEQALARTLYAEATLMGQSAEDRMLTAHALVNMAMQATFLARHTGQPGRAREAIRFADQAADTARHEGSPRLRTLIALRRATAHAVLGDESAFKASIGSARREFDRNDDREDDPAWVGFVAENEIVGHEAMGRRNLGQPAKASGVFRRLLEDRTLSTRNRAYYQALMATSLMEEGDAQLAVREGLAVMASIDHQVSSGRIVRELRPVCQTPGADADQLRRELDDADQAISANKKEAA